MYPGLARTVRFLAVTATLLASASNSHAAEPLSQALCAMLKELNPQVRTYTPEGARAQLVMAIAEKYETDPKQLRQVRVEIDQATSTGCPREREAMLRVVKAGSLAEALD